VRSSPDKHGENIVGGLHHADEVDAVAREGEWVRIQYKGQAAFVYGAYVEPSTNEKKTQEQVLAPVQGAAHAAPPKHEAAHIEAKAAAPAPVEHVEPHLDVTHDANKAVEATKTEHPESPTAAPKAVEPPKPEHVAQAQAEVAQHAPATASATATSTTAAPKDPNHEQHLHALQVEYRKVLREFQQDKLDQTCAVGELIAKDKALHGGETSLDGTTLVAALLTEMLKLSIAKVSKPAPAAPVAAAAPASPTTAAPAHADPAAPAAAAAPIVLTGSEKQLGDDLRALHTPEAAHAADLLAAVDGSVHVLSKNLNDFEYQGKGRDELIPKIAELRKAIGLLDVPGMDKTQLAHLKARVYAHIQDLAPYFSQYRNVDILEQFAAGDHNTRTCNCTSLAMALESLGASPASYTKMPVLQRVAAYFNNEKERAAAIGKQAGKGKDLQHADLHVGADVSGLRMPDFVELAAIAHHTHAGASDKEINDARWRAWDDVLSFGFLADIARDFSIPADVQALHDHAGGGASVASGLRKFGAKKTGKGDLDIQRMDIEHVVDARNEMEKHPEGTPAHEKAKANYDRLAGKQQHVLGDDTGAPIGLEDYKASVMKQVGEPFAAGKAVVIGLTLHFVKLMGFTEKGIIIGDPGMWTTGSHRHIEWAEARAMGYFYNFMIMG
jgi:hypothetical protein